MSRLILLSITGFVSIADCRSDDFTVSNTNDSGAGSLRQALADADANAGDDRILFTDSLDGETLTLTSSQLGVFDPDDSVEIDASNLPNRFTVSGNGSFRCFLVNTASGNIFFRNLSFVNGMPADSMEIGGGSGGGLFAFDAAEIRLENCLVDGNRAADGSDGVSPASPAQVGYAGGGIFTSSGIDLVLIDTIVTNNRSGDGGDGVDAAPAGVAGNSGGGGPGGGIYSAGNLTLIRCQVSENETGNGGQAGGAPGGGSGGFGLHGGSGGGIFTLGGLILIEHSTISGNRTGDGGPGGDGDTGGNGGDGGDGSGIQLSGSGATTIRNSTISQNTTGNGQPGGNGTTGDGGAGGDSGRGAGIFVSTGLTAVTLTHATVASNTGGTGASGGTSVSASAGNNGFDGRGGGIYFLATLQARTIDNTVIAGNSGLTPDIHGVISDQGGVNFIGDPLGIPGGLPAGVLTGDPLLQGLADNGGPTETCLPEINSPLVDAGGALAMPPDNDQRGKERLAGIGPDIGAVEFTQQPDTRIGKGGNPLTHQGNDLYNLSGTGQRFTLNLKSKRTSRAFITVENDGDDSDSILLTMDRPNRTNRIQVIHTNLAGGNVTAAVLAEGFEIGDLPVDSIAAFLIKVIRKSVGKNVRQTFQINAASEFPSNPADVASLKAKGKPGRRGR